MTARSTPGNHLPGDRARDEVPSPTNRKRRRGMPLSVRVVFWVGFGALPCLAPSVAMV
jgi:hypothetical protein